jgi:hypothetical protein
MHGSTFVLVQFSPVFLLLILKILDMKYPCRATRDRAKKVDRQYTSLYQEASLHQDGEPGLHVVASTGTRADRDAFAVKEPALATALLTASDRVSAPLARYDSDCGFDYSRSDVRSGRLVGLRPQHLPKKPTRAAMLLTLLVGCLAETVASSAAVRVLHGRHAWVTRRHVDRRRVVRAATTA